jgi:hypothetical protein
MLHSQQDGNSNQVIVTRSTRDQAPGLASVAHDPEEKVAQ